MSATNHAKQIQQDTKNYLTEALFQLLQTTDLPDIKVTSLVKRAGVSRMAFYRNFETIADVLKDFYQPQFETLFNDVLLKVTPEEKLTRLSDFFETFAQTLLLAEKRQFEPIIQQLFNEQMARFYQTNVNWQALPETTIEYWSQFMAGGVYAIWRNWLINGRKESLATMHELIAILQNSTMTALLTEH